MRSAVIGLIVGLLAMPLLHFACGDRPEEKYQALPNYPATSPSGKYRLVVMEGFDGAIHFAKFDIVSNDRPEWSLFSCEEHFRTWDTTYFLWDEKDRVWVYSGDIGVFYCERMKNGTWQEHVFYQGQRVPPVPEFLKKRRPNVFRDESQAANRAAVVTGALER